MFDVITVPIDESEYGDKAIEYAVAIAEKFGSKIAAVHVLDEYSHINYALQEKNGDEILSKATKKANEVGIEVVEHLITGDALRDMKTIINKTNADLVVMHAFGSNTISEDLNENQIGSVTTRVLETTEVPVLLVK